MRRRAGIAALLAVALGTAGCAAGAGEPSATSPPDAASSDASSAGSVSWAGGVADYQLGGASPPDDAVTIVARDRTAPAPDGVYAVCYVNLFQTQPDETAWWEEHHPDLLLRDAAGGLVVDAEWGEALFDIRTPANRDALVSLQRPWIEGCADDGYDGVEFDNLDQHLRSQGLQTLDDSLAYAAMAIRVAHESGLEAGQKNTIELGTAGADLVAEGEGFDFAVVEECEAYDECDAYPYPGRLIEIEYDADAFARACDRRAGEHPITLRDRDLVRPGEPGYVFDFC